MKKALVLAGGGTRGSYENGAVHALRRLGKDDWNLVCGTSIGALNAVLVVQKDYQAMDDMWHHLSQDQIINGGIPIDMDLSEMISERADIQKFVHRFLKEKGADISPLIQRITDMYHPERFFASDIDFGCVVAKHRTKEPIYVTKEMMKEDGLDWLISTASAYPAFPVHSFKGGEYIDGGYFDNLPIDEALQLGADEIIAIDLNSEPQHPNFMDRPGITYIFPRIETGSFLQFDPQVVQRLEVAGYYDAMKAFGIFDGVKYTFEKADLPSWWHSFYRHLLIYEGKVKLASNLNERFRSSQVITDRLLAQQHKRVLSEKDMFYGLMDNLMDVCGAKVEPVYTYREARNLILAAFSDSADRSYAMKPGLNPKEILDYASSLDTKSILERMVHGILYPGDEFFTPGLQLTVYPFQMMLAEFVVEMMKELGQE